MKQKFYDRFENIIELAKNDFKSKYAGNHLGVFWAFIYPCVTVALYWFVFEIAIKSKTAENVPYILWLISALVPYLFICDAIVGAASSVIDYSFLVKKVKFNTGVLPIVRVLSNLFIHIFFIFLLLIISIIFGYSFKITDLWLVYYFAAEILFLTAAGYLLSSLAVFYRDIISVVQVFTQIGYWLTPLFWEIESVDGRIGTLIKIINPITYITEGFRTVLLYERTPIDQGVYTVYFWGVVVLTAVIGKTLFNKLKKSFGDYI